MKPHVLYLHGFASSPRGRKVTDLRALLGDKVQLEVPDLNVPDFAKLDFAAIVEHAREVARSNRPDVIVGSSLGALIALAVAKYEVAAPLVLIAPALGVADRWITRIPDGDPIHVYNYADEAELPIHRAFFEQVFKVDIDHEPPPSPVTILMGRNDESVPFEHVDRIWRAWEASGRLHPRSHFIEIPDGDHSLTAYVDWIAAEILAAAGV